MRILVVNRADSASCNIRDRLLEGAWTQEGVFRGHPVHRRPGALLVEVDGPVIQDEQLDGDLGPLAPDAVWFLSRHQAKSGQPSLTVHPIGNHGAAQLGGQPGTLSPAAPGDMAALLRRLLVHRDDRGLPHDVTYEATHHGPLMAVPSLFVEIGSDETWYEDRASAEVLAAAVMDVLTAADAQAPKKPVAVGVGGGHYAPQHTAKALQGELDFGHFLPAHAMDAGIDALRRCIEATPGCDGVYVHKKGLKGPQRDAVKQWCNQLGVEML